MYEIFGLFSIFCMIVVTSVAFVFLVKESIKTKEIKEVDKIMGKEKSSWILLAESIIGKSHLKSTPPIPCQDSHHIQMLDGTWGIAIVSDGLGSKPLSHIGSQFVAKKTASKLRKRVKKSEWYHNQKMPTETEWKAMSYHVLFDVRTSLALFSEKNKYKFNDLACTVIAVVFSPHGLLVTHIGDGRAGYRNSAGDWKSMMTPINGETSSHVMPITGNFWNNKEETEQYVESRVINEPIDVFTLMSDGCENFSYETINLKGEHVNKPFEGFFEPVVSYFLDEVSLEERNKVWRDFLTNGNEMIANEPDDKTMIVGILQEEKNHENAER